MSQKMTCDGPSFAATPTQGRPTMNNTCVSVRSMRPSSLARAALRASTAASSRRIAVAASRCVIGRWRSRVKADQRGPEQDGHVSDIEDSGSHRTDADVQEVDHPAVRETIDEVRDSPGEYQAEPQQGEPPPSVTEH